jgi:RNA polymerase-binding transcription factor DksA
MAKVTPKKKNLSKNSLKQKEVGYPEEVLKPVKEHLLSRLFGLEKRRKEISDTDPFKDTSRLDDNAAMDADAAEQVEHLQASALKMAIDKSMVQVRKALTMIKIGRYGICERCGKMIDTDRLVIMPETTLCVDCEKSREK